jgi:SAM-dependent methyltransferase
MGIKTAIPWQAKIVCKVILSRLPLNYQAWQRFGLFRHGDMASPSYAYVVFKKHYERVDFYRKNNGFVALELGPGDSIFSALIASCFNASACYLVDVGAFVKNSISDCRNMINYLKEEGMAMPPGIVSCDTLEEILAACRGHYMTGGLDSLRSIPDGTVDFIWSQAVLEHVRRDDVVPVMKELRRILRKDGACSHEIDLRDHLGNSLNHLRFTGKVWESDLVSKSGFYTNRIRFSEMIELMENSGFNVEIVDVKRWNAMPVKRSCLSKEFRKFSDSELSVSVFNVVLRPQ